jgi:hypothetical protein
VQLDLYTQIILSVLSVYQSENKGICNNDTGWKFNINLNGLFNVTRVTAVAIGYRQMPKKESVKLCNVRFENHLTGTHLDEHRFMPSARRRNENSAFAKSKSCFVPSAPSVSTVDLFWLASTAVRKN